MEYTIVSYVTLINEPSATSIIDRPIHSVEEKFNYKLTFNQAKTKWMGLNVDATASPTFLLQGKKN